MFGLWEEAGVPGENPTGTGRTCTLFWPLCHCATREYNVQYKGNVETAPSWIKWTVIVTGSDKRNYMHSKHLTFLLLSKFLLYTCTSMLITAGSMGTRVTSYCSSKKKKTQIGWTIKPNMENTVCGCLNGFGPCMGNMINTVKEISVQFAFQVFVQLLRSWCEQHAQFKMLSCMQTLG